LVENDLTPPARDVLLSVQATRQRDAARQIYLAMGMDMHKWEVVRDLLVGSNMIKVSAGHLVSLTPNGRDLAVTINETLQSEASA
jgi:hypothetical protein